MCMGVVNKEQEKIDGSIVETITSGLVEYSMSDFGIL